MTRTARPARALAALGIAALTLASSIIAVVPAGAEPLGPRVTAAAPAAVAPSSKQYLIWTGTTDLTSGLLAGAALFGTGGDVFVGDWNGDGIDGFAVRNGNVFSFRNSPTSGEAEFVMRYGSPGDPVLVGDWNGDRRDTIAVRHGASFIWTNTLRTGSPTASLSWGYTSDLPLAGDWNGDGRSSFGLRRGTTFWFLDTMVNKAPDHRAVGGGGSDQVLVGDWDGNRTSTIALRRGHRFVLYPTIAMTGTPTVRYWGSTSGKVFAGNWVRVTGGRRIDSLGAVRSYDPRLDVWQRTNAARAQAGRSALKYDQCLRDKYAQPVTQDNANRRMLQHQKLARGLCSNDAYGENIAAGYSTPESVLTGWMNSPGHKANILSTRWTVMAAGYTRSASSYRYWWSQDFH